MRSLGLELVLKYNFPNSIACRQKTNQPLRWKPRDFNFKDNFDSHCQCGTEARQDFRKYQNMNWNGCGRFRWNGGFVDKRQMFALPWLQHSLTLQTPAPPEYKLLPNMVPAFALECRHCIPTICNCYSVRDSPEDSELTLYRLITLLTLAFFRSSKAWQWTNPPPHVIM